MEAAWPCTNQSLLAANTLLAPVDGTVEASNASSRQWTHGCMARGQSARGVQTSGCVWVHVGTRVATTQPQEDPKGREGKGYGADLMAADMRPFGL